MNSGRKSQCIMFIISVWTRSERTKVEIVRTLAFGLANCSTETEWNGGAYLVTGGHDCITSITAIVAVETEWKGVDEAREVASRETLHEILLWIWFGSCRAFTTLFRLDSVHLRAYFYPANLTLSPGPQRLGVFGFK
jgi:hypothetical protein